jgi:predicted nuclease of predicted toxin-antitoxin system
VRFVVDAQLPPALVVNSKPVDTSPSNVADRGMASASDHVIRDYAASVGAVIVTKDEDFAIRGLLTEGPAIVWLRGEALIEVV